MSSGLIRAFYHLAFCEGAGAGAGLAILGMLRMFTCYRGAIFYKMRAGMGETVFAPLYEVLRRRGVRFEFFHRVQKLELSTGQRRVERVVLGRQATPRSGEYHPLIDVGGLPCWPEQPLYEPARRGRGAGSARREARLHSGAIGRPSSNARCSGAWTSSMCAGDLDRSAAVRGLRAHRGEHEVAAHGGAREDGAHGVAAAVADNACRSSSPRATDEPVMTAYQVPLETWANMAHLLPIEGWRERDGVRGLLYACGQLGQGDDPVSASDPRERRPHGAGGGGARLSRGAPRAHLAGRRGLAGKSAVGDPLRSGRARRSGALESPVFARQRRPLGSLRAVSAWLAEASLAADESGFEGLVLAGDWTRTGYNLGCIEAATMSGLMAARALGAPVSIVGEGPRRPAEPQAALPRYIDRPGEMSLRSPYVMEDVWMTALVLKARQGALGALLDRYLNIPARGQVRYVPAAPFVVLAAAFSGRAFSGNPEHRRLGYMPETDVAFWVPAWAMRAGRGGLIPERLVWFLPHVFVTTGAAAAAGREIYGFPKSVVEVEMRRSGRALDHLSVVGEVLARNTPETCGTRARILEVTRSSAGAGPVRSVAEVIGDVIRPLDSSGAWAESLARRFTADEVTIAFLKQFRDVQHTDRACYQAIIEAKASVSTLRGYGSIPGTFQVSWGDYASHPFTADLGLEPGGQQALAATWVDFDFVMESGREIFRAGDAPEG